MYFYYPMWYGSMPDPSMAPPPPGVFFVAPDPVPHPPPSQGTFKPERSKSFSDYRYVPPFDDDSGDDYGPEYVDPKPYVPPPPPYPPEETRRTEGFRDYTHMDDHLPNGTRTRHSKPYDYPPHANCSRSHSHLHPCPHSHTHSHSHSHCHCSSHSRPSWSSREGFEAWREKQQRAWEDWASWHNKTKWDRPQRQSRSHTRAPSPTRSDGGWRGRARDNARYFDTENNARYFDPGTNGRGDRRGRSQARGHKPQWYPPPPPVPKARDYSRPPLSLPNAFTAYAKVWATLLAPGGENLQTLTFRNIPWPQYPSPRSVDDIDAREVRAFLMAGDRSLKACLREALLRFHPDKTTMLLARVVDKDKADVAAACAAVTRILGQLLKSATL